MSKIKICGLTRECDIDCVNTLRPDYIGFVFVEGRRRTISPEKAALLRRKLDKEIVPVGVFMSAPTEWICELTQAGIIDMIQLHGSEDAHYIETLRAKTDAPIVQAFCIRSPADIQAAEQSPADYILLDSGAGTGKAFDWSLLQTVKRPYFLAGGLSCDNIETALSLSPYAVDASSGLETDGFKDPEKMARFVKAVRRNRHLSHN
ncbi:MAG: phosphoribosylanthranilate isomerase [Acutalibacteraceae bacterium]